MRSLKLLLLLILGWNANYVHAALKQHKSFANRGDVQQFIHKMHQKHGLDKENLMVYFKQYHTNKKILLSMDKQFESSPWHLYRDRLITKKRILNGVRFWKENQTLLKKAQNHFGVPAEIIVAIIGIESSYGQNTGSYPVLQTLATLAFDYPRRAPFFKKELEHFLLLSEEGALHPTKTLGSYAGAIGMSQFMPSSYRHFAVDFSGIGKRDLIYNTANVIGSIANYLKTHGWQPRKPIVHKAQVYNSKKLNDKTQKIKLIELEGSKGTKERWIGFHNFHVITRYNNSTHYAMAVYLLSERIRSLYQG